MSKTAEEILRENGVNAFPNCAIEAMREFATQEVNAYRDRLKKYITTRREGLLELGDELRSDELSGVLQVIDIVK